MMSSSEEEKTKSKENILGLTQRQYDSHLRDGIWRKNNYELDANSQIINNNVELGSNEQLYRKGKVRQEINSNPHMDFPIYRRR